MKLLSVQVLFSISLLFSSWAWADTASPPTPPTAAPVAPESKLPKVDFQAGDVWNVDIFNRADHKVLIIQDRKYTKAHKFEIGADIGITSMTAFYNTYSAGAHAGYYFSEYLGVEAFWNQSSNSQTADANQIQQFLAANKFNSTKEFQGPKMFMGGALVWAPIYGKFAFFRSSIVYFDIYGSAGISVLTTVTNDAPLGTNQTCPGSLLSVGGRIYLNRSFSVRLDVKNNIYGLSFAPVAAGQQGSTLLRTNFQFTAGLSYLFGMGT